jgi:ribonuclease P protein subunit POP4
VPQLLTELLPTALLAEHALSAKVHNKQFMLDNPMNAGTSSRAPALVRPLPGSDAAAVSPSAFRAQARTRKSMSAKEVRRHGLMALPKKKGALSYATFAPLHQLWKQYMADLFGPDFAQVQQQPAAALVVANLEQKLLRADLHGAKIEVTRATSPCYVGLRGIALQETLETFRIIGKDGRVRTIPKKQSVFEVRVLGVPFTLYGKNLRYRSADRTARKFKSKSTVAL